MDRGPETLSGSMVTTMPAEVRALAEPWPSLVGQTPMLTPELEKDFRFGQLVIKLNDQYRIGGNLKGGTSTLWYPASIRDEQAYRGWRELEGIPQRPDREAYDLLCGLFAENQVGLSHGADKGLESTYKPSSGWFYRMIYQICLCLPEAHLSSPQLTRVQLGGWGPDSAKASAYDRGAVIMYDFAISGARRTFLGLFLHELGHAHQACFGLGELAILREHYTTICERGSVMGSEFLLDSRTRQIYQRLDFTEFLAESYMHYCSQGQRLRDFIGRLDEPARGAWCESYALYRSAFDGAEYA